MSKIAWTDKTWNPTRGCSRVSAGCENCYAERFAHRNLGGHYEGLTRMTAHGPRWTGEVRLVPEKLDEPLHWRKPRRVFVNSMSDLFHEKVPDEFIIEVFNVIRRTRQHAYQILTKRPERMRDFCSRLRFIGSGSGRMWLADTPDGRGYRLMGGNGCTGMPWVHLGVSVENQATADERIPLLLETPAAVRWVSAEPLLDTIHFRNPPTAIASYLDGLDWVVVGGESGPGARPCHVNEIRFVRDQCREAGVPCFIKQVGSRPLGPRVNGHPDNILGEWPLKHRSGADPAEWPADLRVQEWPGGTPE